MSLRRFLISAQRSCPEDSLDRTQQTLSWLCWKSMARLPFTLRDLRGRKPVPFRWLMTIRSDPPMRSTGCLSPASGRDMERKMRPFICASVLLRCHGGKDTLAITKAIQKECVASHHRMNQSAGVRREQSRCLIN